MHEHKYLLFGNDGTEVKGLKEQKQFWGTGDIGNHDFNFGIWGTKQLISEE